MATTVDTRGKQCPMPLILFKQALKSNPEEDTFFVLTDNDISCSNLLDFIEQSGYDAARHEEDGYTKIEVNVAHGGAAPQVTTPFGSDQSKPKESNIRVVQLRSNVMGHGNDELGAKLMAAFLTTLDQIEEMPTHIICYNGGVMLATNDSPVLDKLKSLEDQGVHIIVCGTCVSFYGIEDQIAVGKISNMYVISDLLSRAATIVTP